MLSRVVPGLGAGDHALLAQQAVDERRLADVGAADDRDADRARVVVGLRARLEACEHVLHEVLAPLAVTGGDRERRTEPERVEIHRHDVGIQPFGLVEDQRHGLAGAAQLARHELVLRREAGARIGQEHEAVGLGDGALGLGTHLRLDAARVLDQARRYR